MLVNGAGAAAQDLADVLARFAQRHPVQHLRFAQGQAEGRDQRVDGGGVVFFAQDDQPFLVAGLVVEGGEQTLRSARTHQLVWRAPKVFRADGLVDPRQESGRSLFSIAGEVFVQQTAGQRRLPDQFSIRRANGHGRLAEGVERRACLPHLARVMNVGADARQHFGRADGLGDIVGAAGGKGGDDVLGFRQTGHEDDGNVVRHKVGLQAARHFEAVHSRHYCIEQDDVGEALPCALQGRFAVGGDQHRVARLIERVVQQRKVLRDVVDNQHDLGNVVFKSVRSHRGPLSGFVSWHRIGTDERGGARSARIRRRPVRCARSHQVY